MGIGLWFAMVKIIDEYMTKLKRELREYVLKRDDIKRCPRCNNDSDFIVYKEERICRVCNLITDNETGEILSSGSDLIPAVFND